SEPLARALTVKARVLDAPEARLTLASWSAVATELFQLALGHRPRLATPALVRQRLVEAAAATGVTGFPARFLEAEWTQVVDAWGID
ncbi:hypothetical protein Q0N68_14030, partial [Staphylococcus aureus]|nr:hypothetical protein [Staphylococcus aureus]